jgi:glutamate-ammonia-ligase adenylyltransferase
LFGSDTGKAELRRVIASTLAIPRDSERITADAVRMREDIARHKPPQGPFDIKRGAGGLIDLEFAVHTLQLRSGIGLHPHLEDAIADLLEAGLVPADTDPDLRLLTRMLVMFRLVSPGGREPPEATREVVAQACGLSNWQALLEAHDAARQRISELWARVAAG